MVCKHCGRPIKYFEGLNLWYHPAMDRKLSYCVNVSVIDEDKWDTKGPEAEPLEPVDVIKLLKQHGL